jgi:oxalate decarboxylase/phosphoglucose isomerase-like protein (cupin superfamily)
MEEKKKNFSMMTPTLIDIPKINFQDDDVFINIFELKGLIPFEVKRIYTIQVGEKESVRGNHAHLNQEQVIFILKGNALVELTDVFGKTYRLTTHDKAIYIPPRYWIVIKPSANSIILSFASLPYGELISIFDKQEFLKLAK